MANQSELRRILELVHKECKVTTSRSGGAGGQHVNKVETKVTLKWNIQLSDAIDFRQKEVLQEKYKNQINQEGEWVIYHQEKRSQLANKIQAFKKLDELIREGLKRRKKRKRTRPSSSALAARRKSKENRSNVKSMRKKPRLDD